MDQEREHIEEASERSSAPTPVPVSTPAADEPRELAVFDFDGTCIEGNSPVMLVKYLLRKGQVRPSVLARILAWGLAYKMHLPQNEAWVRSLVFASYEGTDQAEADEEMYRFYDEHVAKRIRPMALKTMQEHLEAGREVWLVSATFDPIAVRANKDLPFSFHCATKMRVDENGKYTCEVEGNPVEGAEKLRLVEEHANAIYGPGNWRIAYAYGDHYSDRPLLAAAEHPCAVSPGPTLERYAEKEGWDIQYWK
ncbi:HAD family hydrolase [Anaerotardibacter muris]|uniref:HAD family hydrolase n=1 Tax=Anaerotardibacter muris TaxID=2941505 RepID=UPI002041BF14|nr:HAD-IB family hydrolase [Anaerotardibacter muris]